MSAILIVEDGKEYLDFFRLFLKKEHTYFHSQAWHTALDILKDEQIDLIVLDMRFDRTLPEDLLGDTSSIADEYFGGDLARSQRYIGDNQGTLILSEIRKNTYDQPVLFVQDLPPRKLKNLRDLYGKIHTVPSFDAPAIRREIDVALKG